MYSVLTYDVMKFISHVCETRKFVMAILHWKQGLLCDNLKVHTPIKHIGHKYNA